MSKTLSISADYIDEEYGCCSCDIIFEHNNLLCKITHGFSIITKKCNFDFIKILYDCIYGRVFFNDFRLLIKEQEIPKLKCFCSDNNILVLEYGIKFANIVQEIRCSLDLSIEKIAKNFITILSPISLLNSDYYKWFDFDYNFNYLEINYSEEFSEDRNLKTFKKLESDFLDYADVLKIDFNVDEKYYKEVAWLLLKDMAITYYAEKWKNEFDKSIICIDKNKPNEYLNCVCENDFIDLTNKNTIAYLTYFCIYNDWYDENNFAICYNKIQKEIEKIIKKLQVDRFKSMLKNANTDVVTHYAIDDIDLMDGIEFENFISALFSKMGYKSEVTKHSGDQGIDVIAEKNEKRIGIQAKCYSNSVGNSAIQEVVAGKSYYNCDKVIVITNNHFTNAAVELAQVNNVILWDRNMLIDKITQYF